MKHLVTITPRVWRRLVTQATSHAREAGGLLVGRRVRGGGFHVVAEIALAHKLSNQNNVIYDPDEVARARLAAYEMYGPRHEAIGGWHTHPWPACNYEALDTQITTAEDGPGNDLEDMLRGDIELICSTFPDPGYAPKTSEFEVQRKLGGTYCRAEVWLRVNGEPVPCPVRVRKVD